jgi:hypothetical protein
LASPNVELQLLDARLNELLRTLTSTLQLEINQAVANGTDPQAVIRNIINQIETGTGRFGGLINAISDTPTQTIRQIFTETQSQVGAGIAAGQPAEAVLPASQGYTVEYKPDGTVTARKPSSRTLDEKRQTAMANERAETELMWMAIFTNTCIDCIGLSGQVKTLAEWKASGYWPGNGHTRCGANCKCQLVPTTTLQERFGGESVESIQARLQNGIQLQKRKIEELETIRGEKFAGSTYDQKLGQVRSEFFNPNFEKREPLFIKTEPKSLGNAFIKNAEQAYGE